MHGPSRHGQWNEPISGPLTSMNVNDHPFGVDIGYLEMQSFLQSESERVDDREEAQHGGLFDELQKDLDFVDGQNGRQLKFWLNP